MDYKLYNACGEAIEWELEEAFLANVGRKGRDARLCLDDEAADKPERL